MAIHHLEPSLRTVHGVFDRAIEPVLTIEPGDTVVVRALCGDWGRAEEEFLAVEREVPMDPERDAGHALCGPISVRGAEPGDALEVEILQIVPSTWGHTWAGPRPHLPHFDLAGDDSLVVGWDIDPEKKVATAPSLGVTVPIRPFMGVMGNAPSEAGPLPTAPPRRVGGNLDCRELIAGSTLLLPVAVEGALFSVGDGHAAQGDGEVSQTAIECAMERVELRFGLHKGRTLLGPQAMTPAGFLTIGIGESLDEAAAMALDIMLSHLEANLHLKRVEAMALASIVVDLRVTQVVNGIVGVHAIVPPERIDTGL